MVKKKLLFVAPHLSTGGLPQYLFKKIETLMDDYEIHVIEWDNHTGGRLVVQRNRIVNTVPPERFYTLGENKKEIVDLIAKIEPDFIHIEEMPEYFMPYDIAKEIYVTDRKYKIFETSHDSSFNPDNKKFFPDKLLLVSNYQMEMLKSLDIPMELVEYPIEYKERPSREQALAELGMDPEYKHVINVGLFTARKNQAEIFEYARKMTDHKIKFHFIGNQADNFKFYWEPLMNNKPDNCVYWGERSDVHKFYEAADLFLFTSRGFNSDKETSPLVIREAIGYKVPSLIYNLSVYQNMYDKYDSIQYLNNDGDNIDKILSVLGIVKEEKLIEEIEFEEIIEEIQISDDGFKKIVIIDVYATTDDKLQLLRDCIKSVRNLGHPIMCVSHCTLPEDIVKTLDYHIFDADNSFNFNHVHSFKTQNDVTVNVNINKSHEFPIIRSMRLAMTNAKKLGFDYFYLTEFDHNYSDNGIKQIKDLEKKMISEGKEMTFFYPAGAVFGDVVGQYYDTCFFFGKLDYFIDKFESAFPQTLEEYNANFAIRFPNCLEHFFYNIFNGENCLLVGDYVKGHFSDSLINVSSYRDTDYRILMGSDNNPYLVVTNSNITDYEYEIYQDNKMIDSYILNGSFKLTKIEKEGKITIKVYRDGLLSETQEIEHRESKREEYLADGSISLPTNNTETKNMELKDLGLKMSIPISDTYIAEENKFVFDYLEATTEKYSVAVKDIDSRACIYKSDLDPLPAGYSWWVMPLPKIVIDFANDPTFGGFLIEFRNMQGELVETRERRLKDIPFKKLVMDISDTEPIFMNYEEFFVQKVYDTVDLDNCKTVLDIGANVGLWTKYILSRNAKNVYAFEPNKKAIEHLKKTLSNDKGTNIIEKAVYKERETLQFYIDDTNSLTSSLLANAGHTPSYDVTAITLEDAINITGENKIDLVKIDIEGAEFDIIETTPHEVFDRINCFLIEYHDFYFDEGMAKVDALENKLRSVGYKVQRLADSSAATASLKIIYATKIKKSYYVPKGGVISSRNLYDFSENFTWDEMNAGRQDGYNHLMKEMHFTFDNYTNGNIYERHGCTVENGDVVVDIGANIGAFANYAYHKGAEKIYCFEPADTAFECLARNKPLGAETFKSAVGNKYGIIKITLPSADDTMSGSAFIDKGISNYCPIVPIDFLFSQEVLEKIDFLKIDCEGAELDVIDGISDENLGKISKIALEFHANYLTEDDSEKIIQRLTGAGFRSFQLFLGNGELRIYNFWRE